MLDHFLPENPSAAPAGAPRPRRVHFIETLLQAILHSAQDGNPTKIRQMIDTLYAVGVMPVSQADLAGFEWDFHPPTREGAYYVIDSRHLAWLAAQDLPRRVLRTMDFDMAEIAFSDPEAEARFRARFCPRPAAPSSAG